jgi:thiol-disulfide isomerase/thioredoxin
MRAFFYGCMLLPSTMGYILLFELKFGSKSMRHTLLVVVLTFFCSVTFAVDMELKSLDGKVVNLSDYQGKWVLVNFWATWCPPCIEEMPELQALHDNHEETDTVVIGLNTEVLPAERIIQFLDDYFITYPNFIVGPVNRTVLGEVPALPTSFLVSPEGKVEARQVGMVTREMIQNFIKKWELKQQK